jgi:hypothetical protein
MTACPFASYGDTLDVMQVIWELAERNKLKENKKYNVISDRRIGKDRLRHIAAYGGEQDIMQKIWDCARA